MFSKFKIYLQNLKLFFQFYNWKKTVESKKLSGNALIIGTGPSYGKLKHRLPNIIKENNIVCVFGLNNLASYDKEVLQHLTDYIFSYPGFFLKEIRESEIIRFSEDGDFDREGVIESLEICIRTFKEITKDRNLNIWLPIDKISNFSENYSNFYPFSNRASLHTNNQSDFTKIIYGVDMVALHAAVISKSKGCKKVFTLGLDNESFKTIEWDNSKEYFKYDYKHFYPESALVVNRRHKSSLSNFLFSAAQNAKIFEKYKFYNCDDNGISGIKCKK